MDLTEKQRQKSIFRRISQFAAVSAVAMMVCGGISYAEQVVPPPEFYKTPPENKEVAAPVKAKAKPDSGKSTDYTVIGGKKVQSEDLLNAEGNWNLIEQSEENDPAQAHLKAREKVDPKRRKAMSELSPHFKPDAQSGKDGKFRVLRLEPQGDEGLPEEGLKVADEDVQVATTSVSKPKQTVAEPELIQKVKSLFGEDWQTASAVHRDVASDPESRQASPVAASKAQAVLPPETKPVAIPEDKTESEEEKPILGGFKKLLTSVFSDDIEEEETPKETDIVQNNENQDAHLTVATLPLSPETMQGHLPAIVPPPLPARKLAEIMPAASGTENVPIPQQKPVFAAAESVAVKPRFDDGQDAGTEERRLPNAGQVKVLAIRGGNHPGKARIAIDFSGAVQYRVAIDDIRNVLRVKFENTFWGPELLGGLGDSPLLGSYVVQEEENGSVLLEIRLKKKAVISETMVLRPGVTQNHRVVIDLKS